MWRWIRVRGGGGWTVVYGGDRGRQGIKEQQIIVMNFLERDEGWVHYNPPHF